MSKRPNVNDWDKPKTVVKVFNEDTGKSVDAHVLAKTPDRLDVAIANNKVTMMKNANGVYVGNVLGMSLKSNG